MDTRVIGDMQVGAIGLGCMGMSFAYDTAHLDDSESIAVIHRALDLGVSLLDTADAYGPHTNEELIGRALRGRRDEAVVATKCGLVASPDYKHGRAASPEYIRRAVDGSLQRLAVDVIDLYQLHRVDPLTPLEDSWGAFADLVAIGKVRAIGLSEVTLSQLQLCHAIHPIASVQSELSLWTREWAQDVLPWCRANNVAFLPFSPLGRGFLTGSMTPGPNSSQPVGTSLPSNDQAQSRMSTPADVPTFGAEDFRSTLPRFTPEAIAANAALVEAVRAVAGRYDATAAQVALAWVLAQGPQVIPIPGTKRIARLQENSAATDLKLAPEDLALLDALPLPLAPRY